MHSQRETVHQSYALCLSESAFTSNLSIIPLRLEQHSPSPEGATCPALQCQQELRGVCSKRDPAFIFYLWSWAKAVELKLHP